MMRLARGVRDAFFGVLAVIAVLLVIGSILVEVYPESAARMRAEIAIASPEVATAANQVAGVADAVVARAEQGYAYRIAPLLEPLEAIETTAAIAFDATSCEDCHVDPDERTLYPLVYMAHGLHSDNGIGCAACHTDDEASRCSAPPMTRCANCHTQTSDGSRFCSQCHIEGSLPHGPRIARSRTLGLRCDSCHSPGGGAPSPRVHEGMPTFDRSAESCATCHESDSCASCHEDKHQRGYARLHQSDVSRRGSRQSECYVCHSARWCVDSCHATGRR